MPAQRDDEREPEVLARLLAERGYLLSYHHVYARLEPVLLERYGALYRSLTLEDRFVAPRVREMVWVGLLAVVAEGVGSLHLERARAAGVRPEELDAAVRLAAIATGWPTLEFGATRWRAFLANGAEHLYATLVAAGRAPLEESLADLVLLVAHAALRAEAPFLYHLRRLLVGGMPETHIAEALSYLLNPCGANGLLWATDAWFDGLRRENLPPSPTFGQADYTTRTS